MDLSGFTSLFELFAVFNLGYVGSKGFSEFIIDVILSPFIAALNNSKNTHLKLYVELSEHAIIKDIEFQTGEIENKIANSTSEVFSNINKIKEILVDVKNFKEYDIKFKSLYIVVALFCFTLLLLSGYQPEFNNNEFYFALSILNTEVILFLLIIFTLTFFEVYKKVRYFPLLMWYFLIVVILIASYYFYKEKTIPDVINVIPQNYTIFFSLLILICPFLLHFLRAIIFCLKQIIPVMILSYQKGNEMKKIRSNLDDLKRAKDLIKPYK